MSVTTQRQHASGPSRGRCSPSLSWLHTAWCRRMGPTRPQPRMLPPPSDFTPTGPAHCGNGPSTCFHHGLRSIAATARPTLPRRRQQHQQQRQTVAPALLLAPTGTAGRNGHGRSPAAVGALRGDARALCLSLWLRCCCCQPRRGRVVAACEPSPPPSRARHI